MVARADLLTLLRFLNKVQPDGDRCWLWSGAINGSGYGSFGGTMAHRWIYEFFYGPLGGLQIDHLCRTRGCVNPAHLEAVSAGVNARRAFTAVHGDCCKNGHQRTPENTRIWSAGKKGGTTRYCLDCRVARGVLRSRPGLLELNHGA